MQDKSQIIEMNLGGFSSRYILGPLACLDLKLFVDAPPPVYVIDRTVAELHSPWLETIQAECQGSSGEIFLLPPGEQAKTPAVLESVYKWLADRALTREGTLVGVGGGATLDLAGLAAATWRRGVNFVALPTTLLAMVDASIGGKTGINTAGLKNPVGCFHPASGILADCGFLATLPRRRWQEGMAELIKTAALGDPRLFAELHRSRSKLSAYLADGSELESVTGILGSLPWREWIGRAAAVKARIVTVDFREKGPRKALNLGHTLGHALEAHSMAHGRDLGHGQAVAIGMAVVFRIAAERGTCPLASAVQLLEILEACGLPVTYPEPSTDELEKLLSADKKTSARAGLRWILPERIGKMDLDGQVSTAEIIKWLNPGY
ncbi:MAG: 3-dehydroquinate synthase [Gemmatimonadales bacterium]|nr:3-dehydroquinate synthase [Gemmatimonadales bacterium]